MSTTPLPLEQIDTDAEYDGIRLSWLGDDTEQIAVFTDDPEQALDLARRHLDTMRAAWRAAGHRDGDLTWTLDLDLTSPRWATVWDTCGCGDTCTHLAEDDEHGCARYGLPPCVKPGSWESHPTPRWTAEWCEEHTPGAVPMTILEVSCS